MTKKLVLSFSTMILLLQLLFISYINYNDYIDLQIITSNSLISDKSVSFIFRKDKAESLNELSELIESYPNITLLSELCNFSDLRVWAIYGDCFLENNVKSLINGNFFVKDDFFKQDFKAVVGEDILNSNNCFIDKNGKTYFKFIDNNFEAIGVISTDITEMLNNTVFVNLDSINIEFLNRYVIDGKDPKAINSAVNSIRQKYSVDIVKENNNFIKRYIFNNVDRHILNDYIIIFINILMATLPMFTLCYYNEEIKVKRIIGINFNRVLIDLLKNISVLTLINTAIFASIYLIIYHNFLQKLHLCFYYFHLIAFSFVVLIFMSLIIYLYMLISNNFFYRNGVK